jgi:hypothetical protein
MTEVTEGRLQDSLFCADEIRDFYCAKRLGWATGALIYFFDASVLDTDRHELRRGSDGSTSSHRCSICWNI